MARGPRAATWIGRAGGLVALAVLAGLAPPAVAAESWAVRRVSGAGDGADCVVESERQTLSDGYQQTWAQLTVSRQRLRVTALSVLDGSFGDIGLAVDDAAFIPMDRLDGTRSAVFETRHAALVDQFRRGLRVRVQLRFWPTWPATGPHAATFSLVGFTRTWERLGECR